MRGKCRINRQRNGDYPLALTESILSDGEKILVRSSLIWVAAKQQRLLCMISN